jgi:hypothetical protein
VALREFTDDRGRRWQVWDVYPTLAERRCRNGGPPPGVRERRRSFEWRPRINQSMSRGWLAFESQDGERRRLAPIPEMPRGWDCATEHEFRTWLVSAEPAPAVRRLVE